MQAVAHLLPAEEHDAEKGRLEEEGGDDLIGDDGPKHVAGELGEPRPVGAELVAHDDARHDAEAEGHREHLHPEAEEIAIKRIAGAQPVEFQSGEPAGKADGESRKDDVESNRERELDAREHQGIEFHLRFPSSTYPPAFRAAAGYGPGARRLGRVTREEYSP